MLVKISPAQKTFSKLFAREYTAPHARQYVGRTGERTDWSTYHQPTNDSLIKAHLNGDFWLGTRASWYPTVWNLDIDRPTPERLKEIYDRFDSIGLGEKQRVRMTTPSYKTSGNHRIYLRLEQNEKPVTFARGYEILNLNFRDVCEIYPQKNRVDRLPCGKNQDLIGNDGQVLSNFSWQQEMQHLLNIEPTPLGNLQQQLSLFPDPELEPGDQPGSWKPKNEVKEILENGLQAGGITRAEAQYEILNYFWRANLQPFEAAEKVKIWIRTKNNGFSDEVNAGLWGRIDAHIDRQAAWIYARPAPIYPDSTAGLQGALTRADLEFAAKIFPGSAVRQKQLTALIAYYRPRRHHDFVFIPVWFWREEVAHKDTYKKLVADLESKGILEVNRHYQRGEFCRRYRLKLPATSQPPIQRDDRNVTNFYEALGIAFPDQRAIAEMTGLNKMTLWRHLKPASTL
jgi:hypothetical protein